MEIASEGGEFAPQVGQIYARVKNQRREIAPKIDEGFEGNIKAYAAVVGEPPIGDRWEWFCKMRQKRREQCNL